MTSGLEGKVAFVTGGASGIGRAVALGFAAEKAKVMVADVDEAGGRETVAMIVGKGGDARLVRCDVSRSTDVQAAIGETVGSYGRLDCAFNNAGILGTPTHVHEYPDEEFDRIMAIHVRGVFLCMKHELQHMRSQGSGAIVNTSSVGGMFGSALLSPYSAAKHAIIGLTKSAAVDAGLNGIRVNAICPGIIDTPMTQNGFGDVETRGKNAHVIGRAGRPEEVAALVTWLCSDAASLMTGTAIPVDGGWSAGL